MSKKNQLEQLLKSNPKALAHEKLIRDAVRDVEKLNKDGVGGRGYTLVPPFGEKRQGIVRPRFKLTKFA